MWACVVTVNSEAERVECKTIAVSSFVLRKKCGLGSDSLTVPVTSVVIG